MFTTIDKALAAIVMAGLFLLNEFVGIDLGLGEETVAGIIAALTPILVYFIPNKSGPAKRGTT
jgi:hypothetical protein